MSKRRRSASGARRPDGGHAPRRTTPADVVQLFSLMQRSEDSNMVMQDIAFSKFSRDLECCARGLLEHITDNAPKYGPYLERMRVRLERASERMLVWIVLRYNAMAVISNTGDDQGWNGAGVLFVVLCRCRYLAELCHTAALVLYGRDGNGGESLLLRAGLRTPAAALTTAQRAQRAEADRVASGRVDADHARQKPCKKQRYGSQLPTPFFPLNRRDARRAFRVYTVRENVEVVDDFRPFLLHWRPCDHEDQSLVNRAVFLFGPRLRLGEYTQLQVLMQLQRLADVWNFLSPAYESLYTTLSALLLRTAEIVCHTARGGDLVLDAEAHYRDHTVYEGLGRVAESRCTSKKIVARPDGTVGFEDSDSVRKLKAQITRYGSTAKQTSPQFVRETCGIFRGLYRDLLFYKEHIATRTRSADVLEARAQTALYELVRRELRNHVSSLDAADSTFSQETLQRYGVQRRRGGAAVVGGAAGERADARPPDLERPRCAGSIATLVRIMRQLLVQTASNERDSLFINALVKRIRIDSVPYGSRERFASMNEGIMSSSSEMQERECTAYSILAHRTTFWPAAGLDYFLENHFPPRVHSRVICATFQNMLYIMDPKYVWNDKESAISDSHAQLKPCVFYGCTRELEINSRGGGSGGGGGSSRDRGVLEIVPRIIVIMNSFYVMKENDIYEVPGNNIYSAIVYWVLLFAEQKFTRTHGPMDVIHWFSFEQWFCKLLRDNLAVLIHGADDDSDDGGDASVA